MIKIHNLGFPRIGPKREVKFALGAFWSGDSSLEILSWISDVRLVKAALAKQYRLSIHTCTVCKTSSLSISSDVQKETKQGQKPSKPPCRITRQA